MTDPLAWIDDESAAWSAQGLSRALIPNGRVMPGQVERKGRWFANFGSNDYLGLAADPRVIEAARLATERFGWGAGSSPLVAGWTEAHEALVEALTRFEQCEAALLFPTGFAANLGAVSALSGKGNAVYLDRLAHACLIDGARLSGATLRVFPHNNAGRLAETLDRDRGRFRRSLIVTEGVFSMDGDLAPLNELTVLSEHFGAMLLVDEAHGTGVFGADGRGASSACGVADRVHVRVGTLSKALGSIGGFVVGSRRLIDWLVNHARTQIFSTSLPAAAAAAATRALAIVQEQPWRRGRVHELSNRLRGSLRAAGFDVGASAGPIVPVILGAPDRALALAAKLAQARLFVPAIRPPTVPPGTSRLRISVSAAHTDDDLDALIAALIAR